MRRTRRARPNSVTLRAANGGSEPVNVAFVASRTKAMQERAFNYQGIRLEAKRKAHLVESRRDARRGHWTRARLALKGGSSWVTGGWYERVVHEENYLFDHHFANSHIAPSI